LFFVDPEEMLGENKHGRALPAAGNSVDCPETIQLRPGGVELPMYSASNRKDCQEKMPVNIRLEQQKVTTGVKKLSYSVEVLNENFCKANRGPSSTRFHGVDGAGRNS
jgi:hypothetical protein